MTHLTREDLQRWWTEGAAADRDRILDHLAACDRCGALYGEILNEQPVAPPLPQVPDDVRRAGYRAYRGNAPVWRRRWPVASAAAIAASVLFVVWLMPGREQVPPSTRDEAIRGTSIQPLAPVGDVSRPIEFRWSSPLGADRYVVEVLDTDRRTVFSAGVTSERLEGTGLADLERKLDSGVRYSWRVIAFDRDGREITRSRLQPFSVSSAR